MINYDMKIFSPGEDCEDIYRFRYDIYEKEMQRKDQYSDHKAQIIRDGVDDFSYNIAFYYEDEIVGVTRHTLCKDGDTDFYRDLFDVDGLGDDYPDRVSYSTRLMVKPERRHSALSINLVAECYNLSLEHGVIWSFLDCNDPVVNFFARLGLERLPNKKLHPSFGMVNIMRVDLRRLEVFKGGTTLIARHVRPELIPSPQPA